MMHGPIYIRFTGHILAGVNRKESEYFSDVFAGSIHCYYIKDSYRVQRVYLLVYNAAVHDMVVTRARVCVGGGGGGCGERGEYKTFSTVSSTHTYTENYILLSVRL